jgi:hypothetical protein
MMKEQIIKTAELIKELYNSNDGGVGGYGHIVFDDDNLETHYVEWCIEEAKKGEYNYSEETRLASLKALEGMLLLTEKEREKAKKYYWNELR